MNLVINRTFCLALTAVLTVSSLQAGSVTRFRYDGTSTPSNTPQFRQSVSTLTSSFDFPANASDREQLDDYSLPVGVTTLLTGLQGKGNFGADYGTWTRGYIEAPATGTYLFGVASGDNSEFWLSTNHLPAGQVLVAYEPGSGEGLFYGNRLETRVSAPINLVQGQKYYFEVLHQHGGGAGYIQVGWQRPDGVQEIIPALHLAQYEDESDSESYGFFFRAGLPPAFNSPINFPFTGIRGYLGGNLTNAITVSEGTELLLPLDVIAPQPTTYVWRTNGVVVPGQNLSFFQVRYTPSSYNGVGIQAIISNAYGSITSAVATVTVAVDTVPPTILSADTAGNPNLLQVTYSEPISLATATNLAYYSLSNSTLGGILTITNASLSSDLRVVSLAGSFNFSTTNNYLLRVQGIKDLAGAGNIISPNPSTVAFTLTAPLGNFYTFDSGLPSGVSLNGNAVLTNNGGAYSGSTIVSLTDARANRNGALTLTDRRDVDQFRIRFRIRVSDPGPALDVDEPWGDGFSVNVSSGLPTGTIGSPQFGFSPTTPVNFFSVFFNGHENSVQQPVSLGVVLNGVTLTNILAGTNGIPFNGVPAINNTDGHYALVDINLKRDGKLDLAYDGVTLLTGFQTPWLGINSAQVKIGAATRAWYQTHWLDDLYVNFGEGDVGNVGLAGSSTFGGFFPENSAVNLIAVPTGAGPFNYQWYRNGIPISGGTSRVLTFTGGSGSGGNFHVVVSNPFSTITSTTNTVVIAPDLIPPAVVAARGVAGGVNQVILQFSEPLDAVTATTLSTYTSPFFVVNGAALSVDGRTVTLSTTKQRVGTTYPLTIIGLKDISTTGNPLSTTINFLSSLTYRDEILADQPGRYFKLDEVSGTVALTQTVLSDTFNTNGAYVNSPGLRVPPLVPSASSNEFAVNFGGAVSSNRIAIPNGGDLNDFRGPWAKKSYEVWFKARSLPLGWQSTNTAAQNQVAATAGIWEEGGGQRSIALYVWNPQTNSTDLAPSTSLLTFHSYCSTPDGPGAPYGLLNYPATYVTTPITTNVTYHVVAVQEGDPTGRNGGLRLYVNTVKVAEVTNGIGQIYNHNGDVQIGHGNSRSHLNVSADYGYFDGIIDEVSTFNTVLLTNRILDHYRAGLGLTTTPTIDPQQVVSVNPLGNPNRVNVVFNQPVSGVTATNPSNYVLRKADNTIIPITSAQLQEDLVTVRLNGAFHFLVGGNYNLTVSGVADILAATNAVGSTNLAFTFNSAGPVGIAGSSDLGDKFITENLPVQWSVIPTGQTPYTYQWRSNNFALAGQTNAALSFVAQLNWAANYSVVVANEFSSITSSPPSVLTLLPDLLPPQLVGLRALAGSLNEIRLTFNEAVDPVTATNLATYSVPTADSTGLGLLNAAISANGLEVTLKTTPQVNGQINQLTITNLRDRANTPNLLGTTAQFVSGVSYRDEILSEAAVRYWTFDETSGPDFNTLVTKFDVEPAAYIGAIKGTPTLGVPGLVPNLAGSKAIAFSKANTNNSVDLPNGKDLNAILGPWSKVTHSFTFKATTLPRVYGTPSTNSEAPPIYGHGSIVIYLQGTEDTNQPTTAQLIFKAQNTTAEGPGSPWGGNSVATAKYVKYTVNVGQTYNITAVLDGNASFTGQLRLYVNGTLVDTATGIGLVYKHPNSTPAIAHSVFSTVQGTNYTITPRDVTYPTGGTRWTDTFDGIIDEFSILNGVTLSGARIAQLNTIAQTSPATSGFSFVTPTTPAPTLLIGSGVADTVALNWAANGSADYFLEYTTNLVGGLWISNPVVPTLVNGANTVSQSISNGSRFFRLRKP